ncbi:agamous-like MADS-box protein AGL66 [Raphanus sativus]|nr:agamous-like MADS-box protein AGL66 [Raphanus sativus]
MEETIKKYLDVPIRPRLQVQDEAEIEDEIFKCKGELAKVEQQLGYFLKHPNQWATRDEIEYQEKMLEETLDKIRSQKKCLEAQNEVFDASNCLFQTDMEISPSE